MVGGCVGNNVLLILEKHLLVLQVRLGHHFLNALYWLGVQKRKRCFLLLHSPFLLVIFSFWCCLFLFFLLPPLKKKKR